MSTIKMVNPIFIQTFYYFIVMLMTILIFGVVQIGFFFKFLKVKLSFGRFILAKIRTVHRDYFKVAWVKEGLLYYKDKKDKKKYLNRIVIKDKTVFYKVMGTTWVDVEEETNALLKPNLEGVTGYDPVKFDNLITRAIQAPAIMDKKELIMLYLIIAIAIVTGIMAYLVFKQTNDIGVIKAMLSGVKGTVENIPKQVPI